VRGELDLGDAERFQELAQEDLAGVSRDAGLGQNGILGFAEGNDSRARAPRSDAAAVGAGARGAGGVVLLSGATSMSACDYDYEFDSGGHGQLKLFSSKNSLLPSLFRPRAQIVETELDTEAIQRVAKVLETSLLRTSEGAYGGQFGVPSSRRFHYVRRSIDLITPTERRRIEFPRIFAWREFTPEDQEVLLAFIELWAAVEPTIPDERLRAFTTEWAQVGTKPPGPESADATKR
jgi:hypothetical protein